MYNIAAKKLTEEKDKLSQEISLWVKTNYPDRTTENDKCSRDLSYIIQALVYCLKEGNTFAAEHISTMFYTNNQLQLKSTHVEFEAYDVLMSKIEELFKDNYAAIEHCKTAILTLKNGLN